MGWQIFVSLKKLRIKSQKIDTLMALEVGGTMTGNTKSQYDLPSLHQLILNAAGEGIYGIDCNGRAFFVNDAAVRILGWREEEVIGTLLHDLHHHTRADGTHYPQSECPIYAALSDGEIHQVSNEVFWHSDGYAVPVEYTSTPIWEDGKLKGAVAIFRDVSERVRIEKERADAFEEVKRLKDELEQERDYLRDEIRTATNFGEIIGESKPIKRTLSQIEAVAGTPVSVLILGESGVGKEMVARAIHSNSDRADKPLVKVNCASIPKDLFESEFFGHVKGSFTGAHRDRVGRLQLANGGTLFLDEVGEIPLDLQGKLLRALQESEFERVGDERTVRVDVRVVAATNRDLMEEVKQGRFREDLYYRLSVFPIDVPPLRERIDDVPLIAQHFLNSSVVHLGRKPMRLSKTNISRLKAHDWPGNIRELKNVIERSVILSTSSRDLNLDMALPSSTSVREFVSESSDDDDSILTEQDIIDLQKVNLRKAMDQCDWKISGKEGAAQLLGIKPSTLSYRLNQWDIRRN